MQHFRHFDRFFTENSRDFYELFDFPSTDEKKNTFNDIMRRFVYYLKKPTGSYGENECPFYQPSSQNKMIRNLLAGLKHKYGYMPWRFNEFKFTGGFASVLTRIYSDRQKRYPVS